jgi:prepilin-type N-terminal cleavage/methylation domain-containing protein
MCGAAILGCSRLSGGHNRTARRASTTNSRLGVTLLEMMVVVTIIGTIASISFPAMSAGLAGIRLQSAAGSVASFLESTMNQVDRRERAAAIVILPKERALAVYTAESGTNAAGRLVLPDGIQLEGEEPRRFFLFPGGAFPHITVAVKNDRGARREIEIDPVTAVPKITHGESRK